MRKPSKYKLSLAVKVHVEACQLLCQPLADNDPVVLELAALWADVDSMGRKSRANAMRYHRKPKLASVVNTERMVSVLTVGS